MPGSMSYDLAVWYSSRPIGEDEAQAILTRLCAGEAALNEGEAAVAAFYRDLCSAYPEIDEYPAGEIERCPWSSAHDRSPYHVLVSMRWGEAADAAAELVPELAAKHGLLCYDPQGPAVFLPPSIDSDEPAPRTTRRPWYRFW